MNKEFLSRVLWEAHYTLKAGTTTSYLVDSFQTIEKISDRKEKTLAVQNLVRLNESLGNEVLLPFRICFVTGEECAPVAKSGRGQRKKVAQMKAHFTNPELSPYKIAKPYEVCTSIWQVEGRKRLFWGTIGIVKGEGQKPQDNGDLVLFSTSDWKSVSVYIFKGLALPNDYANLQEAVEFVESRSIVA